MQRTRVLNDRSLRPDGDYVLYWMIAARRAGWSFSLQRARDLAAELDRPLLVFEALRAGYRWASDRLHAFVLDGMRENERRFAAHGVAYAAYVEPQPGEGSGLLETLAERSCAVVTDDWPCFFVPHMVNAAAARLPVRLEAVDSNGLFPMRAAPRLFLNASSFRRFLATQHLAEEPEPDPLRDAALPRLRSLPQVDAKWRFGTDVDIAKLPIDHAVAPALDGGAAAGEAMLDAFVERLPGYDKDRNVPDLDATSRLSPYLHFGHLSAHEIAARTRGNAAFQDQLVTWRELGFNFCVFRDDYDRYESLPAWARATLEKHASDPREHVYSFEEFESARTHDDVWNAAQRQLVREGRIHNMMRMLWGKKILEWTASPREAHATMVALNDKYAIDGRDPNSYSGISWCLGRYDRPWFERPIFGLIRYMSSPNTLRKTRVREYMKRYAA